MFIFVCGGQAGGGCSVLSIISPALGVPVTVLIPFSSPPFSFLSSPPLPFPSLLSPPSQGWIFEGKLKSYLKLLLHLSCPFKWSLNGFALAEEIFFGALGWGWGILVGEKGLSCLILLPPPPLTSLQRPTAPTHPALRRSAPNSAWGSILNSVHGPFCLPSPKFLTFLTQARTLKPTGSIGQTTPHTSPCLHS